MEREGMDCAWVWWSREASMASEEMACNDKMEVMDLRDFWHRPIDVGPFWTRLQC